MEETFEEVMKEYPEESRDDFDIDNEHYLEIARHEANRTCEAKNKKKNVFAAKK